MPSSVAHHPRRAPTAASWTVVVLLVLAAGGLRFYRVADKPFAHDESLFAYYSYCVYPQWNYRYDPLLHGPLLEHLTGALYAVCGDSNFTAHFWPALLGALCIGLAWGFRRRLGDGGALTAAALACVSPTLLFYARFLRNDSLLLFFTLLFLMSYDRWILRRNAAWPAFFVTLFMGVTLCVKENWIFFAFNGATFLLLVLTVDVKVGAWRRLRSSRSLAQALGVRKGRRVWEQLTDSSELLLSLQLGVANGVAWAVLIVVIRQLIPKLFPASYVLAAAIATAVGLSFLLLSILARSLGRPLGRDGLARWFARRSCQTWMALVAGMLIATALYCTLFTTCFRFRWGFFQIYRETLAYWAGQHMEHRLKGPFYYYMPRLLVYETAPLALALGGALVTFARRWRLLAVVAAGEAALVAALQFLLTLRPFDPTWADTHIHMTAVWHLYLAATIGWLTLCLAVSFILRRERFHAFLIWWTCMGLLEYSYAGEKVPWIGVHVVGPLILWAGSEVGRLTRWVGAARGGRWLRASAAAAVMVCVALLAARGVQMCIEVGFTRNTDPGENIIYNHTMPETLEVANEIEEVAKQTGAGYDLGMTVQGEATWPLIWYLRLYTRFSYPQPLETTTDPIIVENEGELEKVKRDFETDYVVRKVGLRQAWVPAELDVGAMGKAALAAAGLERDWLDPSAVAKGREDWGKAWRYFWKREAWLNPGETEISVPYSYMYLRRRDTFPGYAESHPFVAPSPVAQETPEPLPVLTP
ncbi:MAG: TIGR03663 family protein [Candidatus Sumerlaeota bacterium]|nr:TIGR03663 family protein [Candidatus Sumerlaeota bacterium]